MPKPEITSEHHQHTTTYRVRCECGEGDSVLSYARWHRCVFCGSAIAMRPLISAWHKRPGRLSRLQDRRDDLLAGLYEVDAEIEKLKAAANERD